MIRIRISRNSQGNVIGKHKKDIFKTNDAYRITIRQSCVFQDALKIFNVNTISLLEEKLLKVVLQVNRQ